MCLLGFWRFWSLFVLVNIYFAIGGCVRVYTWTLDSKRPLHAGAFLISVMLTDFARQYCCHLMKQHYLESVFGER